MIARLFICNDADKIKKEIQQTFGGNLNHPDILYFESDKKLGIAESRIIKEHFFLKPYSAKGRSAVIENAGVMTDEAQNALLKTIEELPRDAILILGANSDANLLPTILSRCQITYLSRSVSKIDTSEIEKLLERSLEERFEYVEKIKNKVGSFTAIFSSNDPYVSVPENSKICAEKLGAKIIIVENYGHFNDEFGIKNLPFLLDLPSLRK